jgi:hypothetical protein
MAILRRYYEENNVHVVFIIIVTVTFINMFIALALIYGGVLGPGGLLVR